MARDQVESGKMPERLEDLAISAILRAWVSAARPAGRLAGFSCCAASSLRGMQELLQCPCPPTDSVQWRSRLQQLQQNASVRERQLLAASRTIPTPTDRLPLPLILRRRWEDAAHGFFVELTSWHLYLYRVYLLEDSSFEFVQLFLSCAVVSWDGRLDREETLLGVLDRSMFHEGLAVSRLAQAGVGAARVRGVAERVLSRLHSGAPSTFPTGTRNLHVRNIVCRVNRAVRLQYVTCVQLERTPSM